MKKNLILLFMLSITVMLSACASSGGGMRSVLIGSYNYADVVADISTPGDKQLALATHDQREYIVNGEKEPSYVGTARGGFGNPWNVPTASGNPLAQDMTKAISASLKQKGFKVVEVQVPYSDSTGTALSKLKSSNSEVLFLLTLEQWKSDALMRVGFEYNANLVAYSNDGMVLKKKSIVGNDNLGGSMINPVGHAKKAVPEAFKSKIEELFNSPDITELLQ